MDQRGEEDPFGKTYPERRAPAVEVRRRLAAYCKRGSSRRDENIFGKCWAGMTRLKGTDIQHIGRTLVDYDVSLISKTGCSLKRIAMQAVGISERAMDEGLAANRLAVVPITSGGGIIEGFGETVAEILNHLGGQAFVTRETDVAGFGEGIERGAAILFCSDDHRFVALRFTPLKVVDNADATAKGFVTALDLMARGLWGRRVLVIGGAGRVGWKAACLLKHHGAQVSAVDIDQPGLEARAKGSGVKIEPDLMKALTEYRIFLDASPAADLIRAEHIRPDPLIAAPGVPLGLTEEAGALAQEHLIHDPLQIGVATMLAEALVDCERESL